MSYLEIAKQVEFKLRKEGKIPAQEARPVSSWAAFRYHEDRLMPVDNDDIAKRTVLELCNLPFAIRVNLPSGMVYFLGCCEKLWNKLLGNGMMVNPSCAVKGLGEG